jgi:hypothetical protein
MLGQQVPALSNDVAVYWMGRALALPREENGFDFQRSFLALVRCIVLLAGSPGIWMHASGCLLIRDI